MCILMCYFKQDWLYLLIIGLYVFCKFQSIEVLQLQGFQVRGAHLKKLRRAEKSFGVLRVKNHDFKPKNHIFFKLRREARKLLGYFV